LDRDSLLRSSLLPPTPRPETLLVVEKEELEHRGSKGREGSRCFPTLTPTSSAMAPCFPSPLPTPAMEKLANEAGLEGIGGERNVGVGGEKGMRQP
jgi:hypothetical protein